MSDVMNETTTSTRDSIVAFASISYVIISILLVLLLSLLLCLDGRRKSGWSAPPASIDDVETVTLHQPIITLSQHHNLPSRHNQSSSTAIAPPIVLLQQRRGTVGF
jgi:hypothetical protein